MFLVLISSVTCFLMVWIYMKWYKVKTFWKVRKVPHYPPHYLMGSLTFLQRQNPAIWMRKAHNDFKSPYLGIWLFWRPALMVNTPELARRILVKDADIFRNRFLSSGKSDSVGCLTLSTVKDPIWSAVRRQLSSVFTTAKLKSHTFITIAKSKDLVQRIKNDIAKNNEFKLRTVCTDYNTDVIGESAFGIKSEATKTGDSVIRKVTREFSAYNLYRGLSWSSIFFFPELVDIFKFTLFPKDSIDVLRKIFRSVVEQRGGYNVEITDTRDLLDALRKMKQQAAADNEEMSEDLLLAQAAILLLGGFDTTGANMSWILYFLAWYPKHQQRVYEEVLEAKQKVKDKDFDLDALIKLTYLTCVMKEVLRLFPFMGWLDRVPLKDYKIDEHLTIPAGTPVYVNAVGMQVDPEYFEDPEAFNPDRFLPENESKITPYTYLPFGEGPRHCIGMRFAYQSILQGVATVILNFELRRVPNTPKPMDIELEKNGMFLTPVDERMIVQFVPRENK